MPIIESDTPEAIYQQRAQRYQTTFRETKKRLSAIHSARRYLFYGMTAGFAAAYLFPGMSTVALLVAIVCAAVVSVQYRIDLALSKKQTEAENGLAINRAGIARGERDWDRLRELPVDDATANLPIAIDLDLYGHASLMQLLCTAETADGISTLAGWLVDPADPQEVRRRQRVGKSLAADLDWRQELQRRCITIGNHAERTRRFKSWAKESVPLRLPLLLRAYVRVLRFLVPVVVAAFFLYPAVATALSGLVVACNIALTIAFSGDVHSFFRNILATPDANSHSYLSDTFSHVSGSDTLRETMPDAVSTADRAVVQLRRLERILRLESISHNPLTVWFFYFPLQFTLLWDLQLFMFADHWQRIYGCNVEDAFGALAEVEAIGSLASLGYEQPSWEYPEVTDASDPTFVAKELGHPLIPDDCRVANDINMGPPGTSLLITGSNMGGKSTLLRAIGVNAVLAQAGAVCCCKSLTMSSLNVMTSMRVSDSLSDSTSMFMAQLLNLKRIVDQLRSTGDDAAPVMYLFDEILNGTNTSDRRLAVESLMGFLLRCRTIGAMTTHDLEIAKESKHRASFDTHFLGHRLVGDGTSPEIKYDYRLRPGIAPTSNAMLLLRLLGLSES